MDFVHLHCHSHFSKGWGIPSPEEIVVRAKELGFKAIALTDTNGLYGLFPFLEAAGEHGILPLVGSELRHGDKRVLALIRDQEGYKNLCAVISELHCNPMFQLIPALLKRGDGLLFISDMPECIIPLKERYPGKVFFEVSLGHLPHRAYETAKRLGIPPVVTSRACMLNAADHKIHRILRAISLNKKPDRLLASELANPKDFLADPKFLYKELGFCEDALQNTVPIASMLNTRWEFPPALPKLEGLSEDQAFEILAQKTLEGCLKRYKGLSLDALGRAIYELSLIKDKGYCHYFLLVEDIARQALRTCGRGSAAASIVSYALGLTDVDPIAHNLIFERFLNPKRSDPPDIDLDFAWDERDGILQYVFKKYGNRQVALVANQNTFGLKAALRSVARVLGMPEKEINKAIQEVELSGPDRIPNSLSHGWEEVFFIAKKIHKHFYHLSTHCGGIVITPGPIQNYCPVQISPKGYQVLQWEKEGVEEGGLVKIDLLGNRSLAVVRDTISMLVQNHSLREDVDSIYSSLTPLKDEKTLRIFYHARTMGVFYFESPATRRLLTQVSHGLSFEEYIKRNPFALNVVVTSIIRPASNKSIHTWLERLHGAKWDYPHPLLRPVLEETLGVMVFQEQLSQAAIQLAGFDVSEADELRKVVSKKHKEKKLKDFYQRFLEGATKRGVSRAIIDEVWNMMMGFDGYSFCKPHSASYTLLAYKSAYLKAHFPSEFMAAVIANKGGYYSTFAYISEAKRMGIHISFPDINESSLNTKGAGSTIKLGFSEIKGINKNLIEEIIYERNRNGPFISLQDFLKRVKHITWQQIRLLIRANCFLNISNKQSIPDMMWQGLLHYRSKQQSIDYKLNSQFSIPNNLSMSIYHNAMMEITIFGYPISTHPLKLFEIKIPNLVKANNLTKYIGKNVSIVGWWISHKFILTINKDEMLFVTFEDETGLFEVVIFPDTYKRFAKLLSYTPYPFLIRGRVEEDKGAISITLSHIGVLRRQNPETHP